MKLNTKNLKDVEFGFVVLEAGPYIARIKTTVEPNKSNTGQNLVIVHKILDLEVISHDGKKIENRGQLSLTRWVGLQPNESGTYDPDRTIKELGVAAGIDCDEGEEDVTTEALDGAIVKVMVKYRPKEGQYDEANEVSGWRPPSDDERAIAESLPY